MDEIIIKDKCVGCSACESACPKSAISMESDKNTGFAYPIVNNDLCVDCNLCKTVCPVLNSKENSAEKQAYAMYSKDSDLRENSSSGGIFSLLAETVLRDNGVVYGVAMSQDCFSAEHISVENYEELKKLRGSKYLQSNINNSFLKIKEYLENGRNVLFSGTPCQVAGLKTFLEKEYENLLTVDFICHGVPSPLVWRKYIKYLKEINGADLSEVSFRSKKNGWGTNSLSFKFNDGTELLNYQRDDLYMKGFISDLYLRSSCFNCKFKDKGYVSDVTIADFWGIEKIKPEWNDDRGISLVVSNSDKGRNILNLIKEKTVCEIVSFDDAFRYNKSYFKSVDKKFISKFVFKDMNKLPFNKFINKYCSNNLSGKITRKIHSMGLRFFD